MSRKWLRERSKDAWYRQAKREGYRSRASYKLIQINERFNLIRQGDRVVDLGAAPGGWSQVAVELTGSTAAEGTVVGVDLDHIAPMEGAFFIKGDMTNPETVQRVLDLQGGDADVVVSDMSPDISGNYSTDHARSIYLCEAALDFASQVLRPGGAFIVKVFEGDMFPQYLQKVRLRFGMVRAYAPEASRDASSEIYVIGKGFRTNPRGLKSPFVPREQPRRRGGIPATEWKDGDAIPPSWNKPEQDPYSPL